MANVNEKKINGTTVEALNTLRGNLMLRYPEAKAICLTGERPYADKLDVTYGLAKRFAALGKRTLFVECAALDRRTPEDWQASDGLSLTDYLAGRAEAADVVRHAANGPDVIPSGAAAQMSEFISGSRLGDLLREMRGAYDYIIVDATALATCADAAMAACCCDGTLLLTEYGKTRSAEAQRIKQELERDNIRLFGTVIIAPEKPVGKLTGLLLGGTKR